MVLRILNCSDHFWSWGSLHARSPFWAQASASALIRWPSLRWWWWSDQNWHDHNHQTHHDQASALCTYQMTFIQIITIIFSCLDQIIVIIINQLDMTNYASHSYRGDLDCSRVKVIILNCYHCFVVISHFPRNHNDDDQHWHDHHNQTHHNQVDAQCIYQMTFIAFKRSRGS